MKTLEDSRALAREMVRIGSQVGRRTVALITDMDMPLGSRIGNALEVQEAVGGALRQGGPPPARLVPGALRQHDLPGGPRPGHAQGPRQGRGGRALRQGPGEAAPHGGGPGRRPQLYHKPREKFTISPACVEIAAPQTGYITRLDAEGCGLAAVELGAGRETKESLIDFGAGIVLLHNKGDRVEQGQPIARLYAQSEAQCRRGAERFLQALEVGQTEPQTGPMLVERVAEK